MDERLVKTRQGRKKKSGSTQFTNSWAIKEQWVDRCTSCAVKYSEVGAPISPAHISCQSNKIVQIFQIFPMCFELERKNYYKLQYNNLNSQLHNIGFVKTHVSIRPLSKLSAFSRLGKHHSFKTLNNHGRKLQLFSVRPHLFNVIIVVTSCKAALN